MDYMQWECEGALTDESSVFTEVYGKDFRWYLIIMSNIDFMADVLSMISKRGGFSAAESFAREYRINLFHLN